MKLSPNFINEFFKVCFTRKDILELGIKHLKYNFFPNEHYKQIWRDMQGYYATNQKTPTLGIISQEHVHDLKITNVLAEIKEATAPEPQELAEQLEHFIKNMLFLESYDEMAELFQKGKRDETFSLLSVIAEKLSNFKLRDISSHTTVFSQYFNRIGDRRESEEERLKKALKKKIPSGMKFFDSQTYGGTNRGDIGAIMGVSGAGKSKCLKSMGLHAARMGYRVVHIQAEGSEQEAMDAYDAGIAGRSVSDVEKGNLTDKEYKQIKRGIDQASFDGGEIFVKAFEQFSSASMMDVRNYCNEVTDLHGPIDLLLVDYVDEVDPGDGKKYMTNGEGERKRRHATINKFKNICIEFDCAGWTATQANDQKPTELNDPEFCMTRHHISEFKGFVKPLSYFLTMNQTNDENDENVMRIYIDKLRKYKVQNRVNYIVTNFDSERFYDIQKTEMKFAA